MSGCNAAFPNPGEFAKNLRVLPPAGLKVAVLILYVFIPTVAEMTARRFIQGTIGLALLLQCQELWVVLKR